MENREENLIKETCKKLGLTYKELSQELGYTESSLKKSVSTNKISPQLNRTIELYLQNLELKKEIDETNSFRKNLHIFITKGL